MKAHLYLLILAITLPLDAGPRTSADHTLAPESLDSGGGRASSAAYTHDGCLGATGGISMSPAQQTVVKAGFTGSLHDTRSLQLAAEPTEIEESGTSQLAAWHQLDDDSLLAIDPAQVSWSVFNGPLLGVDAGGIATAGVVWQDTSATVSAVAGGHAAGIDLRVCDTLPDNFGLYAGDGLPDIWQVGHFGLDNPLAAPGADPDKDGQDNTFEELVGGDPTDPLDRFALEITRHCGGTADFRITRAIPGRTYELLAYQNPLDPAAFDLIQALAVEEPSPGPVELHDPAATQASRFYTLRITKPPAD